MMRIFLFLVFSVFSFALDFVFVNPVLSGQSYGLGAILKTEIDGEKVFVFERESQPSSEQQEIYRLLTNSQMLNFVFSLREKGLTEHYLQHAQYATNDRPQTPLFIHFGTALGQMGPAAASSFRLLEQNSGIRSDTILVLSPLKIRGAVLQVSDFIAQEYFVPMIAHETFHIIMGDIYGDKLLELKARSTTRRAHDSHVETDEFIAFLEGTAEAMEIAALDMFPRELNNKLLDIANQSDVARKFIKDFKQRRLVTAARNKFLFAENGEKLDGVIKNPAAIFRTEGAVASLFYRVLFKSDLDNPFEKVIHVMAQTKPLTFLDFLRDFCQIWPQDAPTVLRQFLESTHYVTVDQHALTVYQDNYLLKKAWKQKEVDNETMTQSNEFFRSFRLALYQSVLNGDIAFDANIGRPYVLSDENMFSNIDLNSVTAEEMQAFLEEFFSDLLSDRDIPLVVGKLLKQREKRVFSGSPAFGLSNETEQRLRAYRNFYVTYVENQVSGSMRMLKEGIYASLVDADIDLWFQRLLGSCH